MQEPAEWPKWIKELSLNEVQALAAREYPQASIRLLGGPEIWFADLIKYVEEKAHAGTR